MRSLVSSNSPLARGGSVFGSPLAGYVPFQLAWNCPS